MKWLASIAKIAGVSSPFTAWIVQITAERNASQLDTRLKNLEDPISTIHEDVATVSQVIYSRLCDAESNSIDLDKEDYQRFSRPLAALGSFGHVSGEQGLGAMYAAGIRLSDPAFILYMCSLYEDADKMNRLVEMLDGCTRGQNIRAQDLMGRTGLPKAVVTAVFKTFEAKGYGICSKEQGLNQAYIGTA